MHFRAALNAHARVRAVFFARSPWPILAVAVIQICVWPSLAFAQFRQADGTTFGVEDGQGFYWGTLFDSLGQSLCQPFGLLRGAIFVIGGMLMSWLLFRAVNGRSTAWRTILVIMVFLAIAAKPEPWLNLFGVAGLSGWVGKIQYC